MKRSAVWLTAAGALACAGGASRAVIENKGSDTLVNVTLSTSCACICGAGKGDSTRPGPGRWTHRQPDVRNLTIRYGDKAVLRNATFQVPEHEISGIIGPAGSGKTSFLRALNRMDAFTTGMQVEGDITFDGYDVRGARSCSSTS